jgi:hypothetical protein
MQSEISYGCIGRSSRRLAMATARGGTSQRIEEGGISAIKYSAWSISDGP